MGTRGPIPKRTENRRRRNVPEGPGQATAPAAAAVEVPEPDPGWHPIAARWYTALGQSGQRIFYEPSDWAEAYLVAEAMHRMLAAEKISAMMLQTVNTASARLLTTEGDRRRVRIELERGEATVDDTSVTAIADYRRALGG